MEGKVEEVQVAVTRTVHHIHCDRCGKKLFESQEYADGYYDDGKGFHVYIPICDNGEFYNYTEVAICDDCRKEILAMAKEYKNKILNEFHLTGDKEIDNVD